MAAKLRVLDNGTLREITRLTGKQAGVLRQIKTLKVMDGGVLRLVGVFASPLSVTATDGAGFASSPGPVTVTAFSTATPSGGLPPYTYFWTGPSPSSPSAAGCGFSATVGPGGVVFSSATVTVTDSIGQTAEADCSLEFTNEFGA